MIEIRKTTLKDKLISSRLVLKLISTYKVINIFKLYKLGGINQYQLSRLLVGNDEKLKLLVLSILNKLPQYIEPNESVIQKMRELKMNGAKVIILSNTIPESEGVIRKLKLEEINSTVNQWGWGQSNKIKK